MRKQDYHTSDPEDRINHEPRNCEGWRDGAWALESRDVDVPLQGHAQRQALILAHAPLRRVGRGHRDRMGCGGAPRSRDRQHAEAFCRVCWER
jgi:hypothetical protein